MNMKTSGTPLPPQYTPEHILVNMQDRAYIFIGFSSTLQFGDNSFGCSWISVPWLNSKTIFLHISFTQLHIMSLYT